MCMAKYRYNCPKCGDTSPPKVAIDETNPNMKTALVCRECGYKYDDDWTPSI
jgi:transcription elongation factor Elf1